MVRAPGEPRSLVFRPRHRLRHRREFDAVYAARAIAKQGPLTVFTMPNGLAEARLGLSVGRRAGGAVARNGFKRRIREAFRVVRASFERDGVALDVVVVVGAHNAAGPEEYQRWLRAAAERGWKLWNRRGGEATNPDGESAS